MYEWNLVIMVTGNTLVINRKHQVLKTLFFKMRIVSTLYCLVFIHINRFLFRPSN